MHGLMQPYVAALHPLAHIGSCFYGPRWTLGPARLQEPMAIQMTKVWNAKAEKIDTILPKRVCILYAFPTGFTLIITLCALLFVLLSYVELMLQVHLVLCSADKDYICLHLNMSLLICSLLSGERRLGGSIWLEVPWEIVNYICDWPWWETLRITTHETHTRHSVLINAAHLQRSGRCQLQVNFSPPLMKFTWSWHSTSPAEWPQSTPSQLLTLPLMKLTRSWHSTSPTEWPLSTPSQLLTRPLMKLTRSWHSTSPAEWPLSTPSQLLPPPYEIDTELTQHISGGAVNWDALFCPFRTRFDKFVVGFQ